MATVLAAITAFTLVMLGLVGALMVVRGLLLPRGPVPVLVSGAGEQRLEAEAGETLLAFLTRNELFLPSGCGGQGTCGACRIRIREGASALLPTEAVHVGRGEARQGWRLACQVKVRQPLSLELPQDVVAVGRWRCTVRSTRNVATFIREIVLELPEGEEMDFLAGSYVQVECPPYRQRFADLHIEEEYRDEWDRHGLWDLESESSHEVSRAYSLANPPAQKRVLMLNVRIATPPVESPWLPPGVVSTYLFGLEPGEQLTLTGPYGDFFAQETDAEMVFVGGGAGMAPMRSHILDQLERIRTHRAISFWYGARAAREAFYLDLFTRLDAEYDNFEWRLALSDPAPEDFWDGDTGFIHQVLYVQHLRDHPAPEDVEYYLCGPPVMIAACRKMLDDLGVDPANIKFDEFGL